MESIQHKKLKFITKLEIEEGTKPCGSEKVPK